MHNDVHLVPKYNMISEDGKRDLQSAAHKGNLDIVEILLERDANVKNPNATGWTQKALKNKSISDQMMSYENEKKSDEHRIQIAEQEIINHGRNSRQDGIRHINFPLEKVHRDSKSTSCSNSPRFIKKRVTIHLQGGCRSSSHGQNGKLIILPDSLEELLKIAGKLDTSDSFTINFLSFYIFAHNHRTLFFPYLLLLTINLQYCR